MSQTEKSLLSESNRGGQSVVYRKTTHPPKGEGQGWEEAKVNDTLNVFDNSETRTPTLVLENHPADSRVKISKNNVFETLSSRMGTGGGNVPMVLENRIGINGDIAETLDASYYKGVGSRGNKERECVTDGYVVRRLTPLECERLQGFPDGWTDIGDWKDSKGKLHKGDSDAPRYKALGNSIAIPFWEWMADRMVKQLGKEEPTMASLFDGIGGFPLSYSRAGCKPVWASEIEEFPIAVTKKRFGED